MLGIKFRFSSLHSKLAYLLSNLPSPLTYNFKSYFKGRVTVRNSQKLRESFKGEFLPCGGSDLTETAVQNNNNKTLRLQCDPRCPCLLPLYPGTSGGSGHWDAILLSNHRGVSQAACAFCLELLLLLVSAEGVSRRTLTPNGQEMRHIALLSNRTERTF